MQCIGGEILFLDLFYGSCLLGLIQNILQYTKQRTSY